MVSSSTPSTMPPYMLRKMTGVPPHTHTHLSCQWGDEVNRINQFISLFCLILKLLEKNTLAQSPASLLRIQNRVQPLGQQMFISIFFFCHLKPGRFCLNRASDHLYLTVVQRDLVQDMSPSMKQYLLGIYT